MYTEVASFREQPDQQNRPQNSLRDFYYYYYYHYIFFSWKILPSQRRQGKFEGIGPFWGRLARATADRTPHQQQTGLHASTDTREMLQTSVLHACRRGKIQEDHLSAGFQQVQPQLDARSKPRGRKLQGNWGYYSRAGQRQFRSCPQVFQQGSRSSACALELREQGERSGGAGMLLAQVLVPKTHRGHWERHESGQVSPVTGPALSKQDLRLPQALCVTSEGPKVSVLLTYDKSNGLMQKKQTAQHGKAKRGTYNR